MRTLTNRQDNKKAGTFAFLIISANAQLAHLPVAFAHNHPQTQAKEPNFTSPHSMILLNSQIGLI